MKIAISYKPKNGSWGGGNQFVKSLVKRASDEGYEIVYNLKQKDIVLPTTPNVRHEIDKAMFEKEQIAAAIIKLLEALIMNLSKGCYLHTRVSLPQSPLYNRNRQSWFLPYCCTFSSVYHL